MNLQEIHSLLAGFFSLVVVATGLVVLIMMGSDVSQMQGRHFRDRSSRSGLMLHSLSPDRGGVLVDYSFSEGHLVYLSQATASQNTLLLHESTDSVNFVLEPGAFTKNVTLKLEHLQLEDQTLTVPLLGEAEAEGTQPMLKYQLNLPQGPLYTRVTVEAQSALRIKATQWLGPNLESLDHRTSFCKCGS